MKINEAVLHITRELQETGVVSLTAIKADEGVTVALNGEWRELIPLAVTVVHSLMEKADNPHVARLAFVASMMSPELRDMINDAQAEVIYDEEAEHHGI